MAERIRSGKYLIETTRRDYVASTVRAGNCRSPHRVKEASAKWTHGL